MLNNALAEQCSCGQLLPSIVVFAAAFSSLTAQNTMAWDEVQHGRDRTWSQRNRGVKVRSTARAPSRR
jgi:hypothetical protein